MVEGERPVDEPDCDLRMTGGATLRSSRQTKARSSRLLSFDTKALARDSGSVTQKAFQL